MEVPTLEHVGELPPPLISKDAIRRTKNAERMRRARASEHEDRQAANAERMRMARASEHEDRKAANAERMRKARASEQEDRKAVDAEQKRVARVKQAASGNAPRAPRQADPTMAADREIVLAAVQQNWQAKQWRYYPMGDGCGYFAL